MSLLNATAPSDKHEIQSKENAVACCVALYVLTTFLNNNTVPYQTFPCFRPALSCTIAQQLPDLSLCRMKMIELITAFPDMHISVDLRQIWQINTEVIN